MQDSVTLPAIVSSPAKVNLFLRVGSVRPDGFHPLVSWFCSLGLSDTVVFAESAAGLTLKCDRPDVPTDGRNLIVRAAERLMPHIRQPRGLAIQLTKRIPMGGGLGGGSSNAAVALRALNKIWGCGLSDLQLTELAANLGSDVPFFLGSPSAICRGRGEQITPIATPRPRAVLLLLPGIEMPTPQVYRMFDQLRLGTDLAAVEGQLPDPSLSARELLPLLVNDLEAPAFAISPQLANLREHAEKVAGRPVCMSGSGSTLFTLFDDLAEAEAFAPRAGEQLGVRALATTLAY